MTDVLLPVALLASILLVSIAILVIAIRNLRSSRRSEAQGANRYELLRDQHDRLELLREERQMLVEKLERRSRERERLIEFLGKTPPQLVEELKIEREELLKAREQVEHLEQELHQVKEQLERLGQEHQRLTVDLKSEREEHLAAQQQAEQQEQERVRLEREVQRLKAKLDSKRRAPTHDRVKDSKASYPWWRRPNMVVGLAFGALVAWLTSLVVAVYLLTS